MIIDTISYSQNRYITVNLPINIKQENLILFEPYLVYPLRSLRTKNLKNIFVTHTGLCINNNGLIKESHHDYPGQLEDYLTEARAYFQRTQDDENELIVLNGPVKYLVIHHPWFNYYHWLLESIFRLWTIRNKIGEMILVLPESYRNTDFIMGSLEPFKIDKIYFIPSRKSLLIENLCLPQIKPIADSYNYKQVRQVRDFYLNYVLREKQIEINLGDKIYLTRKQAARKHVTNEQEVEKVLLSHGFSLLANENYTFLEQIAIYANAKYLVSIHGSGLTNMLFMKEGSSILELHKTRTNELDRPSFVFWYEAEALNFNYYHQTCKTSADDDYFFGDFQIDIPLLQENLALMLSA
ncbi:glycosyltransferase family 61 protein [Mucilaginibacter sp.]|uniref:glycosyltransferase family 61 protein n=1 Tax=Mucilaginibacter sp. TaxID=1882438 RepID=UPI0025F6DFAC|nr:glycosyltransferase family 61 protein [Mucilaginibacter sp.]